MYKSEHSGENNSVIEIPLFDDTKENKEILILPLKAPLQPKKRFAVGLFSNSRKSLFFPSKQIIMKEIAIMTGAKNTNGS